MGGGRSGYQYTCGPARGENDVDVFISNIKTGNVSCGAYYYNIGDYNHFIYDNNKLTLVKSPYIESISNARLMNTMIIRTTPSYVDVFLSHYGRFVNGVYTNDKWDELFNLTQIQNSKYTLGVTCLTTDSTPHNNQYWLTNDEFTLGVPSIWCSQLNRGMRYVGNLGYPFRIDIS